MILDEHLATAVPALRAWKLLYFGNKIFILKCLNSGFWASVDLAPALHALSARKLLFWILNQVLLSSFLCCGFCFLDSRSANICCQILDKCGLGNSSACNEPVQIAILDMKIISFEKFLCSGVWEKCLNSGLWIGTVFWTSVLLTTACTERGKITLLLK